MTTLKTILYFAIFNYPVTKSEILTFSESPSMGMVEQELDELIKKGIIFKIGDFYLNTNNHELVERRLKGNNMAKQIMPKAEKSAALISQFPFVRGVSFSGSLSKGYFDEKADVDFFIITTKNRLWITRMLLVLYKKIILLDSHKYFCINYFISEGNLEIEEKNKFTAMEIATIIPTHGRECFDSFYEKNKWVNRYFTNLSLNDKTKSTKEIHPKSLKKLTEFILNKRFGDWLENLFYKITLEKWRSKFSNLKKDDFKIALKSTKTVSKRHPKNHHRKVIETLNNFYIEINKNHQIHLDPEHA